MDLYQRGEGTNWSTHRKTFLESRQENGPKAETREDRRSYGTRQNNKMADTKVKSNDSPEIQNRGEGEGGGIINAWPPFRATDNQSKISQCK